MLSTDCGSSLSSAPVSSVQFRSANQSYVLIVSVLAGHSGSLRPIACWDCGFKSRWVHGCTSVISALTGTRPCVWLITRPEEPYWVWCVWVWSWSIDNEALTLYGLQRQGGAGETLFLVTWLPQQAKLTFWHKTRSSQKEVTSYMCVCVCVCV